MIRLSALAPLVLCIVFPLCNAGNSPRSSGPRMQYVEQGFAEPTVFVAPSSVARAAGQN
jgi:hypothetical protein